MQAVRDEQAVEFRIDRTALSVVELTDADDTASYWLTRTPEERLRALELLRRSFYGDSVSTERLQRVLEVAQLERR